MDNTVIDLWHNTPVNAGEINVASENRLCQSRKRHNPFKGDIK